LDGRGIILTILILDTNIIEFLNNPFPTDSRTIKASEIFQSICDGKYEGILIPPVLLEIYYRLSQSDNETYANAFIKSILSMPHITAIGITKDIGMFAGKLYYKYNIVAKQANSSLGHKDVPGGIDCLIAATQNFINNSIVCTHDRHISNMTEVQSDFLGIPT